ncbi:unnamed protein product [Medioppia subpectinata]|uniref:Uncharacterized protein n=1 Tax=Medioppia subpectinata TaxID=1979941 RepID=A0A7R9L440_9ACAR|nr:unnamed protein product [Medioppia subpectinata]CAG2114906.1 unnamed protein product [Medioppia subpectinata]
MGLIKKLLLVAVVVGIGAVIYPLLVKRQYNDMPDVSEKWFGKTKLKSGQAFPKESVAINKFVVNVSDGVLADLKSRLESARYVTPIAGTNFNYGFNGDYLQKITHGWPGSVWEYYKAIPQLIEPTNGVAFEVICPSIPGYGFSEAPHQEGMH